MRRILVQFVVVGALAMSSSGAAIDHSARTDTAKPVAIASDAGKPHVMRIADVDDQLSHEEHAVIAFLSLKAEAERNRH